MAKTVRIPEVHHQKKNGGFKDHRLEFTPIQEVSSIEVYKVKCQKCSASTAHDSTSNIATRTTLQTYPTPIQSMSHVRTSIQQRK
jgi:hypothetical protein